MKLKSLQLIEIDKTYGIQNSNQGRMPNGFHHASTRPHLSHQFFVHTNFQSPRLGRDPFK